MNRTIHALLIAIMAAAMTVTAAGLAQSAEQQPAAKKAPTIYGSQLMTRQERNEYSARMRAARSAEERETLRAEHHNAMQARARARGVTLPDQPPAGAGPGKGKGTGMGPGAGMGPRRDGSGPGQAQ